MAARVLFRRWAALCLVLAAVLATAQGLAPAAGAAKPAGDVTFTGYDTTISMYGGNTIKRGASITAFVMDGETAYCVDPGLLNGEVYLVGDALIAKIEESLKLTIGYGFSADRWEFLGKTIDSGNAAYEAAFVATQFLIWEFCLGFRANLNFEDDGVTAASFNSMGKGGAAAAYTQLLASLREHIKGKAAFTPSGFYDTAQEAVKNAIPIDVAAASLAGLPRISHSLSVNEYINDYTAMRAMYGAKGAFTEYDDEEFEQNALYDIDTKNKSVTLKEGEVDALPEVSGNSTALRFTFDVEEFTKEDGPLLVRIARPPENSPVVTGSIKWFQARDSGRVQRRIQFVPDKKPWSTRYVAFRSNSDGGGEETKEPREIDDDPPVPEFPSFVVLGEKRDAEPGFDGDVHTARGNGTLAAGFAVTVSTSSGTTGGTVYAQHDGRGARYAFAPWTSTAEADDVKVKTVTTEDGEFAESYVWTFGADILVAELVPEGYLPEAGGGSRSYAIGYTISASRTVEYDEEEGTQLGEWTYSYTCVTSDPAVSVGGSTEAHKDQPVALPVFVNRVKKGNAQLVKSYDEDLDQWTSIGGLKDYIADSEWTLQLVDAGKEGSGFSHGGSENHPYVNVVPIASGQPGYSDWGNCYRVTADTSGAPADDSHRLRTSKFGQLYIYDLPYGYYKLQERRCPANEGYVLETVYFTVTDDGWRGSQEVDDEVIENEIVVVKKNSETGKTVPYAGAAFRVRYMGYYHTVDGERKLLENASSGKYITNGANIADGNEWIFRTDSSGRMKIRYPLEYGLWRLEEITAPYGYYIGDYLTGVGVSADGKLPYGETVAVFGPDGERVDYTADKNIVYNYYMFEVSEQNSGEVVVQIVDMTDNPVKGKIEVKKVGEKLAGFAEANSEYGKVYTPVYEMSPLAGAVFEIVSARDVVLFDGYDAPALYDRNGTLVGSEFSEFPHALWPDSASTEYAELPGGTQAYIVTSRQSENDGTAGALAKGNVVSARLLTSPQKGVRYTLSYREGADDGTGSALTSEYDIELGLEYAAGGWNYTYVDMTRRTEADDYVSGISPLAPVVLGSGGVPREILAEETVLLPDGGSVEVLEVTGEYACENGVSVEVVPVAYYGDVTPLEDRANEPELPPEYAEWTLDVEEVSRGGGDGGAEFEGAVYVLTDGRSVLWYVMDVAAGAGCWVSPEELTRAPGGGLWRKEYGIVPPEGFALMPENLEYGYIAGAEDGDSTRFAVLVRELSETEDGRELPRWVPCDGYVETFLRRTERYRFNLSESNASEAGFTVTWGEFSMTNGAVHADGCAIASMYNPSDARHILEDGIGVYTEESGDGRTLTVRVTQPERQAWYGLADGTEISVVYLGGYTRTSVAVPHGVRELPKISYAGAPVDYASGISPANLTRTTDLGGGNYVEAAYDQFAGKYMIEIVSNGAPGAAGFSVEYGTGHVSRSDVVYDGQLGAYRGLLTVDAVGKTLVYKTGTVVQRLAPTDADGIAYSELLPLGTYYVREVSAGAGYVVSGESYRVDLEYAGEYVPLVWAGASAENEALSVTLDIAKVFQNENLDGYNRGAGAVFGIYNKDAIEAARAGAGADTARAEAMSLMGVITVDADGRAVTTMRLPFRQDYYVIELAAPDGYALSGVRHLFRCDETAFADGLKFAYTHDGISGEINRTGLFETTVTVETAYQVPPRVIDVNGTALSTDGDLAGTQAGTALVSQTAYLDKTVTVITVRDQGGTRVTFDNGAVLTVAAYSDGYTAVFAEPAEDGCELAADVSDGIFKPITRETLEDGSLKFTYSPAVAYTAYTVNITAPYRPPETVMTTEDGETTLPQSGREFTITAENASSQVTARLPHDNSYARVGATVGEVSGAYSGDGPVEPAGEYTVNPGETLTLMTGDGALYTASLDRNGVFRFGAEAVINGASALPPDAASAAVDGEMFYGGARLSADTVVEFSSSLTFARGSGAVSELAVKINSRAENHMTLPQESGDADGRPDGIVNNVITVSFIKRDLEGALLRGAWITVYDADGRTVFEGVTGGDGTALWKGALPGTYTFRETRAPEGYALDGTLHSLVIDADGTVSGALTLYNAPAEPETPVTPGRPDVPGDKETPPDDVPEPDVPIPDEPVPEGDVPDEDIPNEDVPRTQFPPDEDPPPPRTRDAGAAPYAIALSAAAACAAGLTVFGCRRPRRRARNIVRK
jgi:hypothetical protein